MASRSDKEREEEGDEDDDESSIFSDFCVCEPSPPFTLPTHTPATLFHLAHQQKEDFSALSPVDRHGRSVLLPHQQQYPNGQHALTTFSPRSPYSTNRRSNRRSSTFTPSPLSARRPWHQPQAIGLKAHHAIPILPFGKYGPYHTGGVQGGIGSIGGTIGTPMDCMAAMLRTSQSRDALQQMFAASSSSSCRKRRGSPLSTLSSSTADHVGSGEHGRPPSVVIVAQDACNGMGTTSIQSNSASFSTKPAARPTTVKEAPSPSASLPNTTTPHTPKKQLSEQDYLQLHREYKALEKSRRDSALSASVEAASAVNYPNSANLAMISPTTPIVATTMSATATSLSSLTDTPSTTAPTTTCGTLTEEQYLHLHMHNMQVQPDTCSASTSLGSGTGTSNPEFGNSATTAMLGSSRMTTLKSLVPSSAMTTSSPSQGPSRTASWVSPLYVFASRTKPALFQPNDARRLGTAGTVSTTTKTDTATSSSSSSSAPWEVAAATAATAQHGRHSPRRRNSSYSSNTMPSPPAGATTAATVSVFRDALRRPKMPLEHMRTAAAATSPLFQSPHLRDSQSTSTTTNADTTTNSSTGGTNHLLVPNLSQNQLVSSLLPTSNQQLGSATNSLPFLETEHTRVRLFLQQQYPHVVAVTVAAATVAPAGNEKRRRLSFNQPQQR